MRKRVIFALGLISAVLVMAGYGRNFRLAPADSTGEIQPAKASVDAGEGAAAATAPAAPVVTGEALPKPQNALDDQEYRWRQLLSRDSIEPIYNPQFWKAAEARYEDDELVIGVEINGEAKAYAIGPLNAREIVNDTLGGVPILVTW